MSAVSGRTCLPVRMQGSVASCSMLECHFSKPAKERIAQMQALGIPTSRSSRPFVRDYGRGIYLADPNADRLDRAVFSLVAWAGDRLDVRPQVPQAQADCRAWTDRTERPGAAKYKDQIEKDLAGLE